MKKNHCILSDPKTLLAILATSLLVGCATPQRQGNAFESSSSKVPGAENVSVLVEVADLRTAEEIGAGRRGGALIAPVDLCITKGQVEYQLKQALERELSSRGFGVGSGNIILRAEVSTCWGDLKTGMMANSTAELIMNVLVKTTDGNVAFSKRVRGLGKKAAMVASSEDLNLALQQALKEALSKLFAETRFTTALLNPSAPEGGSTMVANKEPAAATTNNAPAPSVKGGINVDLRNYHIATVVPFTCPSGVDASVGEKFAAEIAAQLDSDFGTIFRQVRKEKPTQEKGELIITGRITVYKPGSRSGRDAAARLGGLIGSAIAASSGMKAKLEGELVLKEGTGERVLYTAPFSKAWAGAGVLGEKDIRDLISETAAATASGIAQAKGWQPAAKQ